MTELRSATLGALDDTAVELIWEHGRTSAFHYLWLRDNSPQLLHASTRHRVVETSTIAADIRPRDVAIGDGVRRERHRPTLWDATVGDALPRASYPSLLADPELRCTFLRGFRDYGVAVLRDVPTVPGTVLEVAAEFGEIRTTSWGQVFDVVSMPEANSVAYTSLPLVTHTDEGYRDPAPTVQLQHFLASDTTGGESTLVDGFRVAADLRTRAPELFDRLARTSLHFHFGDATAVHENDGPILELDPDGEVRVVRDSNHSVQPFLLPSDEMLGFYEAYQAFGSMRESEQYRLQLPLGPGDLYIVDNHRVLHGRTGFSSTGARHLQSCYIERDELLSRLAVLERDLSLSKGPQ